MTIRSEPHEQRTRHLAAPCAVFSARLMTVSLPKTSPVRSRKLEEGVMLLMLVGDSDPRANVRNLIARSICDSGGS
jgi:hypothetical protein